MGGGESEVEVGSGRWGVESQRWGRGVGGRSREWEVGEGERGREGRVRGERE